MAVRLQFENRYALVITACMIFPRVPCVLESVVVIVVAPPPPASVAAARDGAGPPHRRVRAARPYTSEGISAWGPSRPKG